MACMQQERRSYESAHCEAEKIKCSNGAQGNHVYQNHQKPAACATQAHKPVVCAPQAGYQGAVAHGQQHCNSSNKHHGIGGLLSKHHTTNQHGHSSGHHGLTDKVAECFGHGHQNSGHHKASQHITAKPMHHDSNHHSHSHHSSSSASCEFEEEKKVYKSNKNGCVKSETKIKKKKSFKSNESDSSDSSDSESDNEGCKKRC